MTNGAPAFWIELVDRHGFPLFVAVVLMAAFFGWIPTPMLTEHKLLNEALRQHMREDTSKTFLLRQICQNLANTEADKVKCLRDN